MHKVFGGNPSKGMLMDMLWTALQDFMPKIQIFSAMGMGFFHIELGISIGYSDDFECNLDWAKIRKMHSAAMVHLLVYSGRNQMTRKSQDLHGIFSAFWQNIWCPLIIPTLRNKMGDLCPHKKLMAEVVKDVPRARTLVNNTTNLPPKIRVCTSNLGWVDVDAEYYGRLGKCYVCKEIGHLANNCPPKNVRSHANTKKVNGK